MTQSSATMNIRNGTPDDAPAVAALLGELGYPTTPEDAALRVRRINALEDARLFVAADDGGSLLGLVSAQVLNGVMHANEPVGQITAMIVDSRARRGGVGRALIAAIEGWLRARGCTKVNVTSKISRLDAHAFYEGLGYDRGGLRFTHVFE
ncbi:MAG TPA: GNAT family N-acetyltransferase [Vicinamibacterales bacterium]